MDKPKVGFYNPSTQTFMIVESKNQFKNIMEILTQQKRRQEEEEFCHRLAEEKYDDFDDVVKEFYEKPSSAPANEELMEYDF